MSNKLNTPFIGRTTNIPTTLNTYVKGSFKSIFTSSTPVSGVDVPTSMLDGYMAVSTISLTKQKLWWLDADLTTWHLFDLAVNSIEASTFFASAVDTAAPGTLTLGATNATSILIGRVGITTEIIDDLEAHGDIILEPAHHLLQSFGPSSTTPAGTLSVGSSLNSGDFLRIDPATTGSAPWSMGVVAYDNVGNPNKNNVMTMGWNAGTQGAIDPTKGIYSFTVESEYGPTGGAQMEYYMGYVAPNAAVSYRLLTVNASLDDVDGYSTNVGLVGTQVGLGVGTSINDANRINLVAAATTVNAPANFGSLSLTSSAVDLSADNGANLSRVNLTSGVMTLTAADGYIGREGETKRLVWDATKVRLNSPNGQNYYQVNSTDIRLQVGSMTGMIHDGQNLFLNSFDGVISQIAGTRNFKFGEPAIPFRLYGDTDTVYAVLSSGAGAQLVHGNSNVRVADTASVIFRVDGYDRARFDSLQLRPEADNVYDFGADGVRWRFAHIVSPRISYLSSTDGTTNFFMPNPGGNDTLVARATSDVLTNKTLTSPNINTMVLDGYSVNASTTSTGKALVYNGTAYIPQTISMQRASTSDFLLVDISAHDVATYTPSITSNYIVYFYYRVVTATTNLTVVISWTDGTGVQTATVLSGSPQAVGSYGAMPTYINATTGSAITVTATAGTANQVYMSASIVQL